MFDDSREFTDKFVEISSFRIMRRERGSSGRYSGRAISNDDGFKRRRGNSYTLGCQNQMLSHDHCDLNFPTHTAHRPNGSKQVRGGPRVKYQGKQASMSHGE